ncbi:MAG: OmpP1/FadL family transporter [Saprospiraceae bacterium]
MRSIIIFIFIAFSINIHAQTISDALRYSNLEVGGTARTVGIGGGIGALGADYSVLSTNPAGIAAFRTNEFVITPGVYNSKVTSLLERGTGNEPLDESLAKFNLANIGMVLNYRPQYSKWTTFNLGIGLNRLASFNQDFAFKGKSPGTIVQRFTELANDEIFDDFEGILAENALAIYTSTSPSNPDVYTNDFEDPLTNPDYEIEREQFFKTRGSYSELVFSVGGNFDEKIMVGATVGVPFIKYEEEKTYEERDVDSSVIYFDELLFRENLSTSGTGINLKLGFIYRISQMFRVGAAIHTPTSFKLTDNFSTQLRYDFTDGGGSSSTTEDSPEGTFEYKIKTPWRAMANFAVLVNRKGFITAEVEYVDYSVSEFNLTANSSSIEDRDYEIDLNEQVGKSFQSALNIRIGGEYAHENLRFRAGYGISGTPYADNDITNNAYSLGFGIREKSFYIDFAYKYSKVSDGYVPYLLSDPELEQFVTNDVASTRILMTAGFKF